MQRFGIYVQYFKFIFGYSSKNKKFFTQMKKIPLLNCIHYSKSRICGYLIIGKDE